MEKPKFPLFGTQYVWVATKTDLYLMDHEQFKNSPQEIFDDAEKIEFISFRLVAAIVDREHERRNSE